MSAWIGSIATGNFSVVREGYRIGEGAGGVTSPDSTARGYYFPFPISHFLCPVRSYPLPDRGCPAPGSRPGPVRPHDAGRRTHHGPVRQSPNVRKERSHITDTTIVRPCRRTPTCAARRVHQRAARRNRKPGDCRSPGDEPPDGRDPLHPSTSTRPKHPAKKPAVVSARYRES